MKKGLIMPWIGPVFVGVTALFFAQIAAAYCGMECPEENTCLFASACVSGPDAYTLSNSNRDISVVGQGPGFNSTEGIIYGPAYEPLGMAASSGNHLKLWHDGVLIVSMINPMDGNYESPPLRWSRNGMLPGDYVLEAYNEWTQCESISDEIDDPLTQDECWVNPDIDTLSWTVTAPTVNGQCRTDHYNCAAGTSANNVSGATQWTWNCNGSGGGTNASCSEPKPPPVVNGQCRAAHYNCAAGTSANNVSGATQWTWNCNGSGGGTNARCSEPKSYDLTAKKVGLGAVTGLGFGCPVSEPGPCTANYGGGTTQTFTASPDSGYAFTSWSGCDSTSGTRCTVLMNSDRTITATFTHSAYTLTVRKTGTGTGTVFIPGSQDCTPAYSTCTSLPYTEGTNLTLTETPSPGSTFIEWGGHCSPEGAVTMDSNKTCTARFTAAPAPPTCNLDASPGTITPPATATLSWTTANATGMSINQGIGAVTPVARGSRTVSPTVTTRYTGTATHPDASRNGTCSASVVVTGTEGIDPDIWAEPLLVDYGGTSRIMWRLNGNTGCSIAGSNGDPNFGSVTTDNTTGRNTVGLFGETKYTITCATRDDEVTIRVRPRFEEF